MAHGMTRREFAMAAGAASLTGIGLSARTRASDTKTLRFIAQSDLRVLDPIWTTAGITRNHGYMVYDTPFALDAKFKPQPQMVGDYSISPDKLLYSFTLRDGLKFHDGEPVRATDCVVSLRRWMVRDSFGQSLATAVDKIETADDKSFTIGLKEPFPLLLDALAKVAGPPFIMPERLARTDPYQQVTEAVGSGPYKFVKEEFQPGHMAVYVKNTDYVPRSEPPNWASGGKVVRLDRVEWLNVPDAMTKAAALASGEVDWWENPTPEIWPLLAANPEITLAELDPLGSTGTLRFNHLHPPFDNVKMRQAVLAVTDQVDFMVAYAGDPQNWKLCPSFFTCGTPMANDAGSEALTGKRDFDKAKKLIAEAGYHGEKIVILDAVDTPVPTWQQIASLTGQAVGEIDVRGEARQLRTLHLRRLIGHSAAFDEKRRAAFKFGTQQIHAALSFAPVADDDILEFVVQNSSAARSQAGSTSMKSASTPSGRNSPARPVSSAARRLRVDSVV